MSDSRLFGQGKGHFCRRFFFFDVIQVLVRKYFNSHSIETTTEEKNTNKNSSSMAHERSKQATEDEDITYKLLCNWNNERQSHTQSGFSSSKLVFSISWRGENDPKSLVINIIIWTVCFFFLSFRVIHCRNSLKSWTIV